MINDKKRHNPFLPTASDQKNKKSKGDTTERRHISFIHGGLVGNASNIWARGDITLESVEGHTMSISKADLKRERSVD
jgi:hypothetical protein